MREPAGRAFFRGPAAIDMAIQATQPGVPTALTARRGPPARPSYHGPASTSPGGGIPLGAAAKGSRIPCATYPVPSPFLRYREESDAEFHERLLAEFIEYLDTYEHELGVVLFEPQWGSSVSVDALASSVVTSVCDGGKWRGLAVICDEAVRARPARPRSKRCYWLFLNRMLGSKARCDHLRQEHRGGAGHLLSGAILLTGASQLAQSSRTALQCHTYAGSSARALCNGAALLNRLTSLRENVRSVEKAVKPTLDRLRQDSGGRVLTQGRGALWGGLFAHPDLAERTAANPSKRSARGARRVLLRARRRLHAHAAVRRRPCTVNVSGRGSSPVVSRSSTRCRGPRTTCCPSRSRRRSPSQVRLLQRRPRVNPSSRRLCVNLKTLSEFIRER